MRYVVLPLLGIGIVKAAHHFGMVESDALYQFILMLQYALPPAMGVGMLIYLVTKAAMSSLFHHFALASLFFFVTYRRR